MHDGNAMQVMSSHAALSDLPTQYAGGNPITFCDVGSPESLDCRKLMLKRFAVTTLPDSATPV